MHKILIIIIINNTESVKWPIDSALTTKVTVAVILSYFLFLLVSCTQKWQQQENIAAVFDDSPLHE